MIRLRHGFLDLALDNAPLFFDNQHFFLVVNKVQNAPTLNRPHQAYFVDIQPHLTGPIFINAQQIKRFEQVQVALTGGDNAEARLGIIEQAAINGIGACKSLHSCQLVLNTGFQLRARQIRPSIMKAGYRWREIIGGYEIRQRRQLHRRSTFHRFRNCFKAHPTAAVTRQCNAPETKFQILRNVGRVDCGHEKAHERHIRLMGHGGRHTAMVVASNNQHASVGGTAVCGAMLQRIASAINTRAFAVPDPEYAIHLAVFIGFYLLGSQHDGRREVLVNGRHEINTVFIKIFLRLPQG